MMTSSHLKKLISLEVIWFELELNNTTMNAFERYWVKREFGDQMKVTSSYKGILNPSDNFSDGFFFDLHWV